MEKQLIAKQREQKYRVSLKQPIIPESDKCIKDAKGKGDRLPLGPRGDNLKSNQIIMAAHGNMSYTFKSVSS